MGRELAELLSERNGFYAFESALHVYGIYATGEPSETQPDILRWNDPDCWRSSYGDLADDYLFFAEDVFGGQFAIADGGESIVSFDPETADSAIVADGIDSWAKAILEDFDYLTGHSLASAWQKRHGGLRQGDRLLPKLPFVVGGKYEISNLRSSNAVDGMRFRGEIAVQIANLPEGSPIHFRAMD